MTVWALAPITNSLDGAHGAQRQTEKGMTMYHLVDTLNRKILSSHRTVEAAEFADEKYQRAVRRANGEGSYVPTCIAKGTEAEMRTSMDLAVLNNWSKNFMREALDCR